MTPEANRSYLERFPNGKHAEAVQRRLEYLPLMKEKRVEPARVKGRNDAKAVARIPEKTSSSLAQNLSGKGKKLGSGKAGTLVTLNTQSFKKLKSGKCANHQPDYSKYHTIIHLLANAPLGTTVNGGEKMNAYIASTDGRDAMTGQQRCISFSVDMNSFFSGAGTKNNPAKMRMRAGEPGTRITFDGDESDPFEPVPGLRVWQGAIDIDPECGMVIRARKAR